jgi:Fe2+-dicitrate sensor, membrane component
MDNEQVRILLGKYRAGTLSDIERVLLENWYVTQISKESSLTDEELQRNLHLVSRAVVKRTAPSKGRTRNILRIAAAVLVVSSLMGYFIGKRSAVNNQPETAHQQDVMPGGNRATLTLTNGRIISLRADQNRIVIKNEIRYGDGTELRAAPSEVLALSTPKGGTYEVVLSDGTTVWLNAASTLRYPSFGGHRRVIELEGEAYFEVKREPVPFVVKSRGQEVVVLGTAFNVLCYPEEPLTKTTLVNGRVKVFAQSIKQEVTLEPGQEAVLSDQYVETRQANIASATAWKAGKFRFDETELHEVMQQLSRWYDLEIEYQGTIPEKYFFGVMNRNQKLSEVLEVLREGGVNFRIERTDTINKLIVLP